MECFHPSGYLFPCGLTSVSCAVFDSSGNMARCQFSVEVIDCKSCCKDYNAFLSLLQKGMQVKAMFNSSGDCIALLKPPKLKGCQYISQIQWGDGTITNGQFPDSLEFSHEYFGPGSYDICITIQEGNDSSCFNGKICKTFTLNSDCSSTLIHDLDIDPKVIIYPNPFSSELSIESKNLIKEIQIIDIDGKIFYPKWDFASRNYSIKLVDLPDGIYTIAIHDVEENNFFKRIIKLK